MWEKRMQLGAQRDLLRTKRNSKNEAEQISEGLKSGFMKLTSTPTLDIWPSASSAVKTVSLALRLTSERD